MSIDKHSLRTAGLSTTSLWATLPFITNVKILREMDVVADLIQKCVNENAVHTINQDEYISRYNALVERHKKAQSRNDTLQKKRERRLLQADIMNGFLFAITELNTLQLQFDPVLWHATFDHVTVYTDERLVFYF